MPDSDDTRKLDASFLDFLKELPADYQEALERLIPILYDELRQIAHQRLSFERNDHTLNTTALVHEVYLKLAKRETVWKSRGHFLATASKIMRQLLINYAEKRNAKKRGGGMKNVALDDVPEVITNERAEMLISLDEALQKLAEFDKRGAQIIEYRFFGGLSQVEIAKLLGVTERTVRRSWVMAKTWIQQEMQNPEILS